MSGLSSSGGRAAGVAARETGATAFGAEAEAARETEKDREDDEGADDDADDCWPSERDQSRLAFGEVTNVDVLAISFRHAIVPTRKCVFDIVDVRP